MMRRAAKSDLRRRWAFRDDGQITIFVVIAMAIFLLGFVGFAVDMTNMWFHRQMAQGAADAACQAGIMNLLVPTATQGFVPGTGFNCAGSSSATPCRYAALNGYPGTGLLAGAASNAVEVSFPGTVPGTTPAPAGFAPVPYLRVDIQDRVKLTFASLITLQPTSDVHAQATCAIVTARAPIPIIILNPTCSQSLSVGSGEISIVGGPTKSIQVNSSNTCSTALSSSGCVTSSPNRCASSPPPAASCAPNNASIDLTQGGPSFNGSSFGAFGGPNNWGGGFWTGTSPQATWASPSTPISDPYATLPAPDPTSLTDRRAAVKLGPNHTDPYPTHGCPDHVNPCDHWLSGWYDYPIGVGVNATIGYTNHNTAIFDPGIYYIAPTSWPGPSSSGALCGAAACTDVGSVGGQCRADFYLGSNSVVRQSVGSPFADTSEGTMFYLSRGSAAPAGQFGSISIDANAGKYTAGTVDDYVPAGNATSAPAQCTGNPNPPTPPLAASLKGNVLLGPCTGTYGDSSVDPVTNAVSPIRGMLFFQDRANNDVHGQATLSGGGGLLLAGALYFHNCPASPACQPYNTDYNAYMRLIGNSGSDTRVVGSITVDSLRMQGTGTINMVLDPNRVRTILKATLVR